MYMVIYAGAPSLFRFGIRYSNFLASTVRSRDDGLLSLGPEAKLRSARSMKQADVTENMPSGYAR